MMYVMEVMYACEEDSTIIGIFDSKEKADEAKMRAGNLLENEGCDDYEIHIVPMVVNHLVWEDI